MSSSRQSFFFIWWKLLRLTFAYANLYVFNARTISSPFRNVNLANWRKTSYIAARELFSLVGFFFMARERNYWWRSYIFAASHYCHSNTDCREFRRFARILPLAAVARNRKNIFSRARAIQERLISNAVDFDARICLFWLYISVAARN